MKYIIKNARVIDPSSRIDDDMDIMVVGSKIEKIAKGIDEKSDSIIDAKGMIVAPGLVDMHVHLREPGREDKETVRTGTNSAVQGGFTSVLCMPNTEPSIDSPDAVKKVKDIASAEAYCNVFIASAVTRARQGRELVDMAAVKKAGAVAVSDDGSSVQDTDLMLSALKECKACDLLMISHCEDPSISARGVVNKGFISTKMGLKGIPSEAEASFVKRDIGLAQKCNARLHIAHVSCRESIDIIRKAKKSGVLVTAETAPHYFSLTDQCCVTYDTNTKINPPLRSSADVEAIKEALADGTIDVIATDHAPHTDAEKDVEFDLAPFGIIGLETALSLAVISLVETKVLSWNQLISKLACNPASILGIERGYLKKGGAADLVIIDPEAGYIYKKEMIASKSKNSPFVDWKLKGRVKSVIVGGDIFEVSNK